MKRWKQYALVCAFGVSVLSPVASQQNVNGNKSRGAIILLAPPPVEPSQNETAAGTLHLPGKEYRAGDGWWELSCAATCRLTATKLSIKKSAIGQTYIDVCEGYNFSIKSLINTPATELKNSKIVCIDGYIESASEIHHLLT